MSQPPNNTKIQVRLPQDIWNEVKRLATKHERSSNGEIVWALREYINGQNEKERVNGETKKAEAYL